MSKLTKTGKRWEEKQRKASAQANSKTPKRKSKGKRHPAHAFSFEIIAAQLREHARNPLVDLSTPQALLRVIADAIADEGKRVSGILR